MRKIKILLPSSNTHKHKQKTPIEDAIDWGQNDSVLLFNIFIASVEQDGLFNEQSQPKTQARQTIVGTFDPGENSSTLYFIIVIFSIHSIIYMKASSALKVEIRSTIPRITWIITLPTVSCRALEVLKAIETCFWFVCVSWC